MNKLYSDLHGGNQTQETVAPMPPKIKNLINSVKFASNPNQAIADMINSNPQMVKVFDLLKNSGKSPKELFYELAKQKGVDPNKILKQLQ